MQIERECHKSSSCAKSRSDDVAGSSRRGKQHPVGPARLFSADRTLVIGILNVTPDSFSDGGRWDTPEAAIARGRQLIAEGADIVDIGGESTRPGATRVDAKTELARVLPVVSALADDVTVSVDTMRADVARAALAAGAKIINDVSGGTADPAMLDVIAESGAPYICMYHTGPAAQSDAGTSSQTPIEQVVAGLKARVAALLAAGVQPNQVILDPGLGFAFAGEPNWNILANLDQLVALGYPVLIGASRKRFLAAAPLPWSRYTRLPAGTRSRGPQRLVQQVVGAGPTVGDPETIAVSALAAVAGVWAVRVHDVPGNLAAVHTVAALSAAASR